MVQRFMPRRGGLVYIAIDDGRLTPSVIASGAKQSRATGEHALDCFAALAMTDVGQQKGGAAKLRPRLSRMGEEKAITAR